MGLTDWDRGLLTPLRVALWGVIVAVPLVGVLGIVYAEVWGEEPRGPSIGESVVERLVRCPSSDVPVEDLEEAASLWAARGWPMLEVATGACVDEPGVGVVHVRRCSDGGQCDQGERAGQADTVEVDGVVQSGTIWVRGRFERQESHVWHEVGHMLGVGLEWHDEHEGRVMSADAGWSWEGLER